MSLAFPILNGTQLSINQAKEERSPPFTFAAANGASA